MFKNKPGPAVAQSGCKRGACVTVTQLGEEQTRSSGFIPCNVLISLKTKFQVVASNTCLASSALLRNSLWLCSMLNEHALLQTHAPDEQLLERAGKLVHDQPRPAFQPCQTPVSAQLFTWQTLCDHVSNLSSDKRKKKKSHVLA